MLVMVVSVVKRDNEPRIDFKAIEGKAAIDNIFLVTYFTGYNFTM